jgi:hypothetical protein
MLLRILLAGLMFSATALAQSDSQNINFDDKTDFSKIKTFRVREGMATTEKPEINNTLFLKNLGIAIREELLKKGLKETADKPDILVDYRVDGTEFSVVREGQPETRVPDVPGIRGGMVIRGMGPQPVRYSEGMLAIDVTLRESNLLVWQGIYRDQESKGSKLAQKLPADAKKLLSKYPPKKK